MRLLRYAAAALALMAAPASATEWIYCGTDDGSVSVGVLAGAFEFLNISAATMSIGDESWASSEVYGPGATILVGQAYQSDNQIIIDISDDNAEAVLGELRVYTAEEGTDYVQGGVFRAPGRGVWVVSCEGP